MNIYINSLFKKTLMNNNIQMTITLWLRSGTIKRQPAPLSFTF